MDEIEQAQALPETPQKLQIDSLPEKIKNSLYVHNITDDNIIAFTILLSHLPKEFGFIRPARNGEDLSYFTIKSSFQPLPLLPVDRQTREISKVYFNESTQKRLLTVISSERKKMTAIFFNDDTPFSSLKNLSLQKKLVLNLISTIDIEDEHLENTQLETVKQNINQQALLNNKHFYKSYIHKEDQMVFSPITNISLLQNNIYLLKMADGNIALISKAQLIAAKNYNPAPKKQVTFNNDTNVHAFHKPVSRKRKAENDANTDPAKKAKTENILKNSPAESHSSAGEHPEQQNTNTTASYSHS